MSNNEDDYKIPFYWKLFFCVVLSLLIAAGFYFVYKFYLAFNGDIFPSNIRGEWGTLGDFFGGVLNPIFGFASFLALLATIFYQARELNASTKELKNSATALAAQNKAIELQSFEQTFFSWLGTYHNLLNSTSGTFGPHNNEKLSGRSYLFKRWQNEFSEYTLISSMIKANNTDRYPDSLKPQFYDNYEPDLNHLSHYNIIKAIAEKKPLDTSRHILITWTMLLQKYEYQFDCLINTLFKLLTWVDTQPIEKINYGQKLLYIGIIRSQLSWIEMVILFHYCLSPNGKELKLLIEKYSLLENVTIEADISMKVLNDHMPKSEYFKPNAFQKLKND